MAKTKRSKGKREELAGQADPRATLDSAVLLAASQPVLARLEADLLARAKASPAVTRALEARYAAEKQANRTAEGFAGWTAALATQVAAAWLLSCVFVRTLEDRGLLRQVRIAGPGAEDSQRQFFQLAPSLTERDYLMTVFRELAHHPAAQDLFDAEHSLVWKLSPSAEVAKELLALFRAPSASEPAFRFGQASTRFLGDLYQDLSEEVRKRYALLQTPDFIEEFILDRTLEPAIQRFGLDDTTLIDPTCGSGHFLLGAFDRLFEHRLRAEPGVDPRVTAVKALNCVYGADINPYAVAIARFRLTLSFLEKAGYKKLADAPALPLHLVVADSLRINPQHPQQELWQAAGEGDANQWLGDVFTLEDEHAARDVLFRQYAAVVGNPPYITVKDASMREVYRAMYVSAAGKYALSTPFCERLFQLARPRGYTGQITSNAFMKREFGKRLIEDVLPKVNVELIVNTSGAYIPGHGTPTVLLFGTHEPRQGNDVLAVLAKRGEPSTPNDPSQGLVWRSIADHFSEVGFENDCISVARVERASLEKHPWSLGGGGASELKELLEERGHQRLGDIASSIGVGGMSNADDVFNGTPASWARLGVDANWFRSLVIGEEVRDWAHVTDFVAFFPYDSELELKIPEGPALRALWPYRQVLWSRAVFGGGTYKDVGRPWFEWHQLAKDRLRTPLTITFAFVATHNHFVLVHGDRIFGRTAPIVKLSDGATEDDHLALLAYINSSTACFWMKQIFFDKGNRGEGGGTTAEAWEKFFEYDGTKLRELPIPLMADDDRKAAVKLARRIVAVADVAHEVAQLSDAFDKATNVEALERHVLAAVEQYDEHLATLRSLQEQIDWLFYCLFGLISRATDPLGAWLPRASDVLFARRVAAGEVGERYFSLCRLPQASAVAAMDPPAGLLRLIDENPLLQLIEQPVYKRTFREGFRPINRRAQSEQWLLERVESVVASSVVVESLRTIVAETLRRGTAAVVKSWIGEEVDLSQAIEASAVPFLAAQRFNETGLEKFQTWLKCWAAQRREDANEEVVEKVIPDRYVSSDFAVSSYYKLRGKLDVPRERFIAYPGCESDNDGEPVYGWAGWDHLQRAQALASLYLKRKDGEGWTHERLTPMLAGLLELIPWVKQWHNEPSEEFNGLLMGDYYEQFLDGECRQHGLTHDDLRAWRPPMKTRGKTKAKPERDELDDDVDVAARRPDAGESDSASAGAAAAKPPKKTRTRKKRAAADEAPVAEEGD